MTQRVTLLLAAGLSLMAIGQAPASTKPCRNKDGTIVACPKPPRAVSPRCKDEKGRFTACRPKIDGAGQPVAPGPIDSSRNPPH